MHDATQPVTPSGASPPGDTAPAGPAAADLTGTTIGEFDILRRLGHGGMGHVYLAEQRSLKRKVALKFLRLDTANHPTGLSRFRREAEAVAKLSHPNIVQVYAIGEADGRHYMALEYVQGMNLRDYVTRKGPPEVAWAVKIMRQVAAALQRAAESGIVHRDIKPENILLTRKGEVKVADFGLSRDLTSGSDLNLTQTGLAMGTPLYMSPEQAQGKPLDPRSDIYSFGVTCYHMLAGQPPFRGQNALQVALMHVNDPPPPLSELRPDLPPSLIALVHRMMAKAPDLRPQSAREIIRELSQPQAPVTTENPFAGLTVPQAAARATPPSGEVTLPEAPAATEKRHVGRWVAVAGTLILAVAGGAGLKALSAGRSVPPVVTDDHPNLPVVSDRERALLSAITGLYEAPKAADKIRQGAGHHVELGVLHWEQKRYADAERLFEDMIRRTGSPPFYRTIGSLGLAVTYALRDEVDRSNKAFQEIKNLSSGYRAVVPQPALPAEEGINLRHWVLTALDRNATRGPLPKELEDVRKELRRPRANLGGKAG